MRAFAYCDGEQIQIECCLSEAALAAFSAALVDLGKSPASCSATCQSSDASPLFKGLKAMLRGIWGRTWKSPGLEAALKKIFAARTNLEGQKSRLIDALQQIVTALRQVMKDSVVKEGYSCIGQYPFNFRIIMSKCTTPIPLLEFQKMDRELPHFASIIARHGRITEAEMDAKGIMSINATASRQLPKNQRVLHQERAVVLTAADSIAKYRDYQREREMAPVLAAQRQADRQRAKEAREAKAAVAKVAQEAKAAELKAKKDAKAAEKRRWEGLTSDEQKAETSAKRRRTRELKAAAHVPAITAMQENEPPLPQLPVDDDYYEFGGDLFAMDWADL